MRSAVDLSTRIENGRNRRWPGRLAMTLGLPLALLIYFLLLEQYGFPLLNVNGDEKSYRSDDSGSGPIIPAEALP